MSARGGLGRGLGALIPAGATSLEEIPPSAVHPNPRQPRKQFDQEALSTLSASIRQLGLLQPVVVRRRSQSGYELVMGERRWRAAQQAGLSTIPALIIDTDDRGSLERAIVENVHRQDLNPIEEAAAYRQLVEEAGLTQEQLAERVGLSRSTVGNVMRLLDLPDGVQALVMQGKLSAGHAKALLSLLGHPLLERIAQRVAASGLTVRETEELVRREREEREEPAALEPPMRRPAESRSDAGLLEISEALSDQLETRVQVTKGRGKGKIVIEFGSDEDLVRIWRRIASSEAGTTASAV
ncbi:MAG TPA: ParB/RepB/Spo0J family partition protein [Actinomycetota bacterium]|nr:ParB/RepB/Spo0J family partition protein [Actinomycetota bacterium]